MEHPLRNVNGVLFGRVCAVLTPNGLAFGGPPLETHGGVPYRVCGRYGRPAFMSRPERKTRRISA